MIRFVGEIYVVPEEFWVDKSQCRYIDANGQTQNPGRQPCAEGISAVKAIAIAQQQGQKVYTITQANAATALPKLPIGGEVGAEIRNAIQAGKEVTFHEARIHEHGWSGYGYSIVDPETGAGAYLIEGKGNGAVMFVFGAGLSVVLGTALLPFVAGSMLTVIALAVYMAVMISILVIELGVLIAVGAVEPGDILIGSAAALSLMRALAMVLAGTALAFSVPSGIFMGLILLALSILGFGRLSK